MSISDAWVTVTCDECGEEEDHPLSGTARGGYDDRYLESQLKREGWIVADGEHICPSCQDFDYDDDDDETNAQPGAE